ncbi:MAG: Gfo/Idh/MocA family oxidoreductase [Sedimentisphaerales bacterium]|nr:Gfo/Idh/MocA family oxidoreductase [Sedimentisphaerales bacterium]
MKKTVNRRSFLRKTAGLTVGLAGFPYIIPSSALGKAGTTAPSNRLTLAQIGCGGMGGNNLKSFLEREKDIQVIAVCDVDNRHAHDKKRLVDTKYENNDCKIYRDFRELIASTPVDIVSHALPDHWHALVTVACARKGIDMYGEKPFSRTIGEGRAMCRTLNRYGIVWQTGSWQRSEGAFRRVAELVRNGRIGKISHVEVGLPDGEGPVGPKPDIVPCPDYFDYDLWLGPAPWRPYQNFDPPTASNQDRSGVHYYWRHISDYSGGKLTDWIGHHVDIAHWALGFDHTGPVEIEGKGDYPVEGIYDVPYTYDIQCTYADGTRIRIANKSKLPHGQGICWYGDKGWIFINRRITKASDAGVLREKIGPDEAQLYRSQDHYDNFIDCVKSRGVTAAPAETAHRSISVGLLGEIAMLTGRKLNWHPDTETFIKNDQANRYLMRSYRSPWHL